MGLKFEVGFDQDSQKLIQLVRSDPSNAFGSLYSTYMLFLIGEQDESELKWLLDNAKALDSLTGNHIAYIIFVKQFKVKLQIHSNRYEGERTPEILGQIELANIEDRQNGGNVTHIIKNGRFGIVMDGDELTAITYGTDFVARELGLLGRLPCVVIIDAIPAKNLCVIGLDQDVTSSLMAIMRKAISEFETSTGDLIIRRDAERLIGLQNSISCENKRDTDLRVKIISAIENIKKFKTKIKKGNAYYAIHPEQVLAQRLAVLDIELQNAMAEHDRFTIELDELAQSLPERLAVLDIELQNAIVEHRRHKELLFSRIFERHVRGNGLQKKLGVAQTSTLSYLGSLIKPDILLKVWKLLWL